ncbi:crossover junction endodeoxyribonuclease RuvC [Arenivirga flava]|uniref:Crossover junction endodeoxyribonuclease RuvC n=1 Tax=Arenivirga flava TaxID=1930060 RepID=A0AA37XAS1_9MICO|nr:crossover junction endodeoxyribonuclease RuvC [Arenivirga flava]GMA27631.1 crossover junction endodeoxyribonuclease RuvC [Arenivirga flava]
MSLRVLGIDPGLTRCGVGIVDVDARRRGRLVHVDVLRTPPDLAIERRLLAIGEGIAALLDEHRPDRVALERVFAQHNVRSVMGVAQISGVAMHESARRGLAVALHTPSEVKAAVTGYGSADKAQVASMVARILGLTEAPRPADAADALAIALCNAWGGGGASVVSAEGGTPAQRAWRAAEKSAGARRLAP